MKAVVAWSTYRLLSQIMQLASLPMIRGARGEAYLGIPNPPSNKEEWAKSPIPKGYERELKQMLLGSPKS